MASKINKAAIKQLLTSAAKGETEPVAKVLASNAVSVDFADNEGQTALHLAAGNGREATVKLLIEQFSANVLASSKDGRVPLHFAALAGHQNIVQILTTIKRREQLSFQDSRGQSPLHIACLKKRQACVQMMLELGANPDLKDNDGNSPLSVATKPLRLIIEQSIRERSATLQQIADIRTIAQSGTLLKLDNLLVKIKSTPLSQRSQSFTLLPTTKTTLSSSSSSSSSSAAPDAPAEPSPSPTPTTEEINAAVLQKLLNTPDDEGQTAIWAAVIGGNFPVARKMIELGADFYMTNQYGRNILHHLATNGLFAEAQFLVRVDLEARGIPLPSTPDTNGSSTTPDSSTSTSTSSDGPSASPPPPPPPPSTQAPSPLADNQFVKALVEKYEPLCSVKDNLGRTPLHWAAAYGRQKGQGQIIDLILTHYQAPGLDINDPDAKGQSPFLLAVLTGHCHAMRLLLKAGANSLLTDNEGLSALHLAAAFSRRKAAVFLMRFFRSRLPASAPAPQISVESVVQSVDDKGNNALHIAIIYGRIEVIQTLIEEKVSLSLLNEDGLNPLHLCVLLKRLPALNIFLEAYKTGPLARDQSALEAFFAPAKTQGDQYGNVNSMNVIQIAASLNLKRLESLLMETSMTLSSTLSELRRTKRLEDGSDETDSLPLPTESPKKTSSDGSLSTSSPSSSSSSSPAPSKGSKASKSSSKSLKRSGRKSSKKKLNSEVPEVVATEADVAALSEPEPTPSVSTETRFGEGTAEDDENASKKPKKTAGRRKSQYRPIVQELTNEQVFAAIEKADLETITNWLQTKAVAQSNSNDQSVLLADHLVIRDGNGSTPLLLAIQQGNEQIVSLITSHLSEISLCLSEPQPSAISKILDTPHGLTQETPLALATKLSHSSIVQILLASGATPLSQSSKTLKKSKSSKSKKSSKSSKSSKSKSSSKSSSSSSSSPPSETPSEDNKDDSDGDDADDTPEAPKELEPVVEKIAPEETVLPVETIIEPTPAAEAVKAVDNVVEDKSGKKSKKSKSKSKKGKSKKDKEKEKDDVIETTVVVSQESLTSDDKKESSSSSSSSVVEEEVVQKSEKKSKKKDEKQQEVIVAQPDLVEALPKTVEEPPVAAVEEKKTDVVIQQNEPQVSLSPADPPLRLAVESSSSEVPPASEEPPLSPSPSLATSSDSPSDSPSEDRAERAKKRLSKWDAGKDTKKKIVTGVAQDRKRTKKSKFASGGEVLDVKAHADAD